MAWRVKRRDAKAHRSVLVSELEMIQPGGTTIVAETEWANPASVAVLRTMGFLPSGVASTPEVARQLLRETSDWSERGDAAHRIGAGSDANEGSLACPSGSA